MDVGYARLLARDGQGTHTHTRWLNVRFMNDNSNFDLYCVQLNGGGILFHTFYVSGVDKTNSECSLRALIELVIF